MLLDGRPQPPAAKLSRVLGSADKDGIVRVVLESRLRSAASTSVRRAYAARRPVVRDLIEGLRQHYHLYADVSVDEAAVSGLPDGPAAGDPAGLFVAPDDKIPFREDAAGREGEKAAEEPHDCRLHDADGAECAVTLFCHASVDVGAADAESSDAERWATAVGNTVRVRRAGEVLPENDYCSTTI